MDSFLSPVSHDVTTLITHSGIVDAHPVVFTYDPRDPYAMKLTVASAGVFVEWVFARDLLRDGLDTVAGQGDVALFPDSGAVVIELHSIEGSFRLECARQGVQRFVADMYETVPEGSESDNVDVDRWIYELRTCA